MTLVSIPANPVPDNFVTGTIKTPDGAELRFARWAPPAGRKGTVCVFTGRSEQIEKYFETVRDLRDRGFAVAMIDWRGQGHSSRRLRDPRKGYVRDFSDYEVDVETFVQQVVLPDCPPPHFALAHSMGGAVMLRVAHAGKRWFDRMVLSAPMIDLPGHATSFPARALLSIGAVMMAVVSVACCVAALGLWRGRRWGRYVAGTLLIVNAAGDLLNGILRSDLRTLIGVPIAAALLYYLRTDRVRAFFKVL